MEREREGEEGGGREGGKRERGGGEKERERERERENLHISNIFLCSRIMDDCRRLAPGFTGTVKPASLSLPNPVQSTVKVHVEEFDTSSSHLGVQSF